LHAAKRALIIGNSSYTDSPLKNTINDSKAISELFKTLEFNTIQKINVNRRDFEETIDNFVSNLSYGDEVVFYYSGHGVQIDGENFLIPIGKTFRDEKDVKYDAISANKITEKLSKARISIIILDACRDNPFKGVRSSDKGLATMSLRGGNQFVIYSTASGQTASDGAMSTLSPFTESFVKHASYPGVTIEEMMRNVIYDVKVSSNERQIPFYYGSMDHAFYLNSKEKKISLKQPHEGNKTKSDSENKMKYFDSDSQIELVFIEGGSFLMGSNDSSNDAKPKHEVSVASFYIGRYEVSQSEWSKIMSSNPSYWKGDDLPVEQVSWYDAVVFCNRLSISKNLTPVYELKGERNPHEWGEIPISSDPKWNTIQCDWSANGFRLPTEAEWEYSSKGGITSLGFVYSGSNDVDEVAWFDNNSKDITHNKGLKKPNELSIYDMSGNVREWCWDWYDDKYYVSSPKDNPTGPDSGTWRCVRGGSWYCFSTSGKTTTRFRYFPDFKSSSYGFRVVRRSY